MRAPAYDSIEKSQRGAEHGPMQREFLVLPILVLFYILNAFDRTIISLMVIPIRRDMSVTDGQLGFMLGLGFALFYGLCSLPFGMLADRVSRPVILWASITGWSMATIACGLARGYHELLFARMALGIGEAALAPAAMSILADRYAPSRLARAMSIFLAGGLIGNSIAMAAGGAVVAHFDQHGMVAVPILGAIRGWQVAFILLGTLGIMIAPLAALLRGAVTRTPNFERQSRLPIWPILVDRSGVLLSYLGSFIVYSLLIYACNLWVPTFLVQTYHWSIAKAGLVLGLINLIGSAGGTFLAGLLTDRLVQRGYKDAYLRYFLLATIAAAPFGVAAFWVSNDIAFITLFAIFNVLGLSFGGCGLAGMQAIAPPEARATFAGLYSTSAIVIGAGLGPWAVGLLADQAGTVAPLGSALLVTVTACSLCAILSAALGRRPLARILSRETHA